MYEKHIEVLRISAAKHSEGTETAKALDAAISALKKQERYEALLEAGRRFVND